MANWEINKGIGRTVEFKGLKAQYLFLFAGGLLAVFILVVVLYLCGVSQMLCLVIGVVGATIIVWQTFAMNRKYGQWKSHTNLTHPGKYFRPSKVKIMRPTSPK